MAARSRLQQTQDTRARIRTTQLVKRLEDHVLGDLELSGTQVRAALGLIAKTLPDVKAIEGDINIGGGLKIGWQDSHSIQSERLTGSVTPESEEV